MERSALPSSLLQHRLQSLFNLGIAFEKELELLHAETCKVEGGIGFQRGKEKKKKREQELYKRLEITAINLENNFA